KIKKFKNKYIIKISKGERVRESLVNFAKEYEIGFARISAIGMLKDCKIGFIKGHGYDWNTFDEVEVTGLNGNISWNKDETPNIHMHITVGTKDMSAKAGHFDDGIVSAVMEVFIDVLDEKKMYKEQDGTIWFNTWEI
ncbi:MAG: DNA-binding protein, partial [Mollicutes bacterium PWAP]|nr:DNA-binding protein [Mollicutes bacterium PWAP]